MLAQENVFLSRDYWKANPSVEQIKLAITEGNSPSELNKNGFDAVVYALLEKTNYVSIKYLLTLEGNDLEKRTHDSRTYIFWAAYKGNINIMKHLFDKGAVINITDSKGNTPVTFAAVTGQKKMDVYELFETQGLPMSEIQKDGNNLLHIAIQKNNLKLLESFATFGIDVNTKNADGYTSLHIAAMKAENDSILKYLLSVGADKKITTEFNETAFDLASENELLQRQNIKLNFLQ
jgi:ankyrin repeat protein